MFFCPCSFNCSRNMPVIGSCYMYCINILSCKDLFKIEIGEALRDRIIVVLVKFIYQSRQHFPAGLYGHRLQQGSVHPSQAEDNTLILQFPCRQLRYAPQLSCHWLLYCRNRMSVLLAIMQLRWRLWLNVCTKSLREIVFLFLFCLSIDLIFLDKYFRLKSFVCLCELSGLCVLRV